jgi:arylsulfatase A-like enzyme
MWPPSSFTITMKTLLLTAILILAPLVAIAQEPKPNVLLIISDDQGYGDFGFTGNKIVQTPVLDRLAADSAVYRNSVVAPACSPSRAAILTGRDHMQTGVWGVPPRANLRPDEARMPAFFQAAGYRTAHIGKLDCVKVGKTDGDAFGWDEWTGGGGYQQKDPMIYSSAGHGQEQGWTAEIWTQRAVDFIKRNQDRPWFLSLAYIIPHLPWACPESYSAPFLQAGCSKELAECYGSIAHMDECIGRVLAALRATGQAERTIVVFVSDNGPAPAKGEEAVGDDWKQRNVAGLRGRKATVWENGIRVPLIVHWTGRIPPGGREAFVRAEDILPTLLELAGVSPGVVAHLPFDGVSFAGNLTDPSSRPTPVHALRIAISGPGSPAKEGPLRLEDHHVVLRGERFKLHHLPGGQVALYDLLDDPGEATDVAAQQPKIAEKMLLDLRAGWSLWIKQGRAFAGRGDAAAGR